MKRRAFIYKGALTITGVTATIPFFNNCAKMQTGSLENSSLVPNSGDVPSAVNPNNPIAPPGTGINNPPVAPPIPTPYPTPPPQSWPAWRRTMKPYTWAIVPTLNVLADLDPTAGATNVAPPGANWVSRGQRAGFYAWTGGVWDEEALTFYLPMGGGHYDYGGNEPYKIRLGDDSPAFVMIRPPSGALPGPSINAFDSLQPTGLFSDGRLRPVHTYNNVCFVPGLGPVLTRLAGSYPDGTNHPSKRRAYQIDAAGEAILLCDFSAIPGQGSDAISTDDGAAAFDPTRGPKGSIWTVGHGNSTRLIQIDVATKTAVPRTGNEYFFNSGGHMVYVPKMDVLAFFNSQGELSIMRLDQGSTNLVKPSTSGNFSAGLNWPNFDGGAVDWAPELGKFLIWINENNRTEISTLTPTDINDPSAPWIRGVLPIDMSNSVTPPLIGNGGPFGRGRYSRFLRGWILITNTDHRPHFFATG